MPICRWLLVGCVLSAAIIAESPDMDDDLAEVFEGMAPFPARSVSSSEASGSSNQPAGATPAATSGAPSDDPNNAPIAPEAVAGRAHWSGVQHGERFRMQFDAGTPRQTLVVKLTRLDSGLSGVYYSQ